MERSKFLIVEAGVRYWDDAVVNGEQDTEDGDLIPFNDKGIWRPIIRLQDGQILNWPEGVTADIHYKVCDSGEYFLSEDSVTKNWKWKGHYVPNRLLCVGDNGYGDYIIFKVGQDGKIIDWVEPELDEEHWDKM